MGKKKGKQQADGAQERLSDRDILKETERFEKAKRLEGRCRAIASGTQARIVGELVLREAREWDGSAAGEPGMHVTLVQAESRTVDEAGLYAAMTPRQRTVAFR
ncbi:hypothetical protein, partial [Longimicrobium sp.]|uniref:hypothetical protein n=1 Tax=Longimicrobium sp. TaxID=2029185 RepID=UPI002E300371